MSLHTVIVENFVQIEIGEWYKADNDNYVSKGNYTKL